MIRRFVNIVAQDYKNGGMYSLHRLEVSKHLFYPSTAEAEAVSAAPEALAYVGVGRGDVPPPVTEQLLELPAPCMSFQPSGPSPWAKPWSSLVFDLVSPRSSEGRVLCINNRSGHALLYDADSRSANTMPSLRRQMGINPVLVSVARAGATEEDFYIMHNVAGQGFDVLRFGTDVAISQSLPPPPPFVRDPRYELTFVRSYAVVDNGRTICISVESDGQGTYCFDTVENKWSKAGDWVLPFQGRVDYIPELKLWLGFSPSRPYYLCGTSDLSSMTMTMDRPPRLQCVWQDLKTPSRWCGTRFNLINLGAGRFCIAKTFRVKCFTPEEYAARHFYDDWDWDPVESQLTVLTGIEIFNTGVDQGNNNLHGPKIFKHKSIHYKFMDDVVEWVL